MSDSLLPNQVEILYEGETVNKLASSTFVIWNSGNKIITKNSLTTIDPLRIEAINDVKILRHEIIRLSNHTCNISTHIDENKTSILLSFDFLEKNDGVRIKILHTGNDSDINLVGKVIGVKTPKTTPRPEKIKSTMIIDKLLFGKTTLGFYLTAIVFLTAIFTATIIWPDEIIKFNELSSASTVWMLRAFAIINLFSLLFLFGLNRTNYPAVLKENESEKNEG
ncbi:hypothetical protein D8N18_RS21095 [Escherichia coli]|uniref:hypothetical protein n=1 Tax=Escherichia coli TaxID=562 RepID=UPI0018B0499C|nr:hypothetical protein [Escherichia coli]EED0306046.1 hypothetical protein [Escherichia coli]QPJ22656.1 hypothetical protein H7994_00055 [Escherichia coli O150:H6]